MATKKKSLLKKPAVDERKLKQWAMQGEALAKAKNGNQWAIGDWILAGAKTFGTKEAYNKAQQATGMTRATLQQFKYTAECFPISTRVKNLFFGHHRLVADKELTPEERKRLLQHAKGKSVASFAAFLKARKKDLMRRDEKRSLADQAADKVVDAFDTFIRSYLFTTLLTDPPSTAKRTELLNKLKKAAADLTSKMEEIARAWREQDAADEAFQQGTMPETKALGVAAK
jgi:hypothetical protein